ncbi:MAG: hypothetical protein HFE49_03025 [Clostridia bacterium]|nr:hypothetical protein [Clostridia bacterium]
MINRKIEFIEYAKKYHECQKQNEIEEANKYAKKMFSIKDKLKKEKKYEDFLDDMLFCSNHMAQIWACGMSIDFNYRKTEAIDILHALTLSKDDIISKNSKMSLYVRCKMNI